MDENYNITLFNLMNDMKTSFNDINRNLERFIQESHSDSLVISDKLTNMTQESTAGFNTSSSNLKSNDFSGQNLTEALQNTASSINSSIMKSSTKEEINGLSSSVNDLKSTMDSGNNTLKLKLEGISASFDEGSSKINISIGVLQEGIRTQNELTKEQTEELKEGNKKTDKLADKLDEQSRNFSNQSSVLGNALGKLAAVLGGLALGAIDRSKDLMFEGANGARQARNRIMYEYGLDPNNPDDIKRSDELYAMQYDYQLMPYQHKTAGEWRTFRRQQESAALGAGYNTEEAIQNVTDQLYKWQDIFPRINMATSELMNTTMRFIDSSGESFNEIMESVRETSSKFIVTPELLERVSSGYARYLRMITTNNNEYVQSMNGLIDTVGRLEHAGINSQGLLSKFDNFMYGDITDMANDPMWNRLSILGINPLEMQEMDPGQMLDTYVGALKDKLSSYNLSDPKDRGALKLYARKVLGMSVDEVKELFTILKSDEVENAPEGETVDDYTKRLEIESAQYYEKALENWTYVTDEQKVQDRLRKIGVETLTDKIDDYNKTTGGLLGSLDSHVSNIERFLLGGVTISWLKDLFGPLFGHFGVKAGTTSAAAAAGAASSVGISGAAAAGIVGAAFVGATAASAYEAVEHYNKGGAFGFDEFGQRTVLEGNQLEVARALSKLDDQEIAIIKQNLEEKGESVQEAFSGLGYDENTLKLIEEELNSKDIDELYASAKMVHGNDLRRGMQIIQDNEGTYDTVEGNDNGALSIGKFQWHGNRALNLLRAIDNKDQRQSEVLMSDYPGLLEEIRYAEDWSDRTLTDEEAVAIKELLSRHQGSTQVQDTQGNIDYGNYLSAASEYGTTDGAKIFLADLINQYGSISGLTPGNLDSIYEQIKQTGYYEYSDRRDRVYNDLKEAGFYATGGKISQPTLSVMGEGGYPEFVIPTDPQFKDRSNQLISDADTLVNREEKRQFRSTTEKYYDDTYKKWDLFFNDHEINPDVVTKMTTPILESDQKDRELMDKGIGDISGLLKATVDILNEMNQRIKSGKGSFGSAGSVGSVFGSRGTLGAGGTASTPGGFGTLAGTESGHRPMDDDSGGVVHSMEGLSGNSAADVMDSLLGSPGITSDYGINRWDGLDHGGIDYGADEGTPIPTPVGGEIYWANADGEGAGYGNAVQLIDANGNYHLFAHMMDAPDVYEGQTVQAGTVLGRVGNTGHSFGAHLHYQIDPPSNASAYKSGAHIDPHEYAAMATGGLVDSPTFALLGEGGFNEYVISTDPQYLGRSAELLKDLVKEIGSEEIARLVLEDQKTDDFVDYSELLVDGAEKALMSNQQALSDVDTQSIVDAINVLTTIVRDGVSKVGNRTAKGQVPNIPLPNVMSSRSISNFA